MAVRHESTSIIKFTGPPSDTEHGDTDCQLLPVSCAPDRCNVEEYNCPEIFWCFGKDFCTTNAGKLCLHSQYFGGNAQPIMISHSKPPQFLLLVYSLAWLHIIYSGCKITISSWYFSRYTYFQLFTPSFTSNPETQLWHRLKPLQNSFELVWTVFAVWQ